MASDPSKQPVPPYVPPRAPTYCPYPQTTLDLLVSACFQYSNNVLPLCTLQNNPYPVATLINYNAPLSCSWDGNALLPNGSYNHVGLQLYPFPFGGGPYWEIDYRITQSPLIVTYRKYTGLDVYGSYFQVGVCTNAPPITVAPYP